ncbi:helix-turn-helix transcriptional regulator [Streptomyces sp. NPDC001941]|uniref:helix-turn-helix domain-containing protein n=1 Tax=Streptomyces sp. NPDC001941 TaxID=3154659 RepID=UPI003326F8E0
MPAKVGTTIRRIQLGQELLRLRERAGLTLDQAAEGLPFHHTRISKLENGTTKLKTGAQLRQLLERYGVTDDKDVAFLVDLHANSFSREWWHPYRSVMPSGMSFYVGLEQDATRMSVWQPNVVFGLLQTEAYARSLFEAAKPIDERTTEFVERNTQVRMERQNVLHRSEHPMELYLVLDEAVLRRVVGNMQIMREQYLRIIELSELDHVTVQILPLSHATYRTDSNFAVVKFEAPDMTIVQVDVPAGVSVADRDTEVWKHTRRFDALQRGALGPGDTPRFLHQLVKEVESSTRT